MIVKRKELNNDLLAYYDEKQLKNGNKIVRVRRNRKGASTVRLTPLFLDSTLVEVNGRRRPQPLFKLVCVRKKKLARNQIPQILETNNEAGHYVYETNRFRFAREIKHKELINCDTSRVFAIYKSNAPEKAMLVYEVDMAWIQEYVEGGLEYFLNWAIGKYRGDGRYDAIHSDLAPLPLNAYTPVIDAEILDAAPIFISQRYLTKGDGDSPLMALPKPSLIDCTPNCYINVEAWQKLVDHLTEALLLKRRVELSQRELAAHIGVCQMTLSRYVNELYESGYLTRIPPSTIKSSHIVTSFKLSEGVSDFT